MPNDNSFIDLMDFEEDDVALERVSVDKYNGAFAKAFLKATLNELEFSFGDAHYHYDANFPDDNDKCSVCFGFINPETGRSVSIWSFKIWHYQGKAIDHTESVVFSAHYEDEGDYDAILKKIKENRKYLIDHRIAEHGYSKVEIEKRLNDTLHEALRSCNQEDGIVSLEYKPETGECVVKFNVHIVEEDDYIGFDGY